MSDSRRLGDRGPGQLRDLKITPDFVRTADGSRSAQYEHSLAITDSAPEVLTSL